MGPFLPQRVVHVANLTSSIKLQDIKGAVLFCRPRPQRNNHSHGIVQVVIMLLLLLLLLFFFIVIVIVIVMAAAEQSL